MKKLPEEFTARIKKQDYINSQELFAALDEPSVPSIRINKKKWESIPADSTSVPWCDSGWYLRSRPSYTLDPLFHAGCYYPQEASSMFLERAFRQVTSGLKDLRVLDLCAAPGGKTTHLSSIVGDDGVIIANEVIRARASILAENVTKWGSSNIVVTNNDPAAFAEMGGYFDVVVVDAPCSGEGMFRDNIAREEWSPGNAALCCDRQKRILSDIWPAIKTGGVLIYSTCTFNPAENEENIAWLAERTNSESISLDISDFKEITGINFNGITGYGFHPGKTRGEGFFIAAVKKSDSAPEPKNFQTRKISQSAGRNELKIAEQLGTVSPGNIFLNNEIVWSLAVNNSEFEFLRNHLKIIKGGTQLFRMRGTDFTPVHDLALSLLLKKEAFPVFETEYNEAISFLKRDNIPSKGMPAGWVILSYRNVNMGFIKNIGSRVNNYFPVEWRIRMATSQNIADNIIEWQ